MFRSLALLALLAQPALANEEATQPSPAGAATLESLLAVKQWEVAEELDPILNTTVCRAYTRASDSAEALELSLNFPKDGLLPPTITLKTKAAAPLISLKISREEAEPFFLLRQGSAEEANVYWYAPLNFARLEQLIRAKNQLEIFLDPNGTPIPVKISLAGSSATLDQNKKCLAKGVAFPKEFFQLLNSQKDALVPDLGDRTPAFLLRTVNEAFGAFREGQGTQAQIAALRKAWAPQLKKEADARKVMQDAATKRDRAQGKVNEAKSQITTLEAELAQSRTALQAAKEEKPRAEADLAQKKAAYLPLKEQMAPYEKKIAEAQGSVKEIGRQIQRNENTIAANRRQIRQLESERADLQRAIPGWEQEASRLSSDLSRADSAYRSYNPDWERRRILDSNWSYRWAKDELEDARRDQSRLRSELWQAEGRVRDIEGRLNQCRAQPNPNCGSLESELSQAQSQANNLRNQMSQAESRERSAEWKIRSAESDADREVQSEQDRLRRIRDNLASELNSVENRISSARSRIAQIRGEIPALQREIDRAQNALPGLRESLAQAEAGLEAAKQARQQFADQIGFGAAETAYRAAEAHLASVVKQIADLTKSIPIQERNLKRAQAALPPLEKDLLRAEAALAQAIQKHAPLEEALGAYRAEETVLNQKLAEQDSRFRTGRATYQDLYKELLGQR